MSAFLRLPPKRYLLPGIVLYLVFLAALLPAGMVSRTVSQYSHETVELRQVAGYWWKGSSQQVVIGTPATGMNPIGALTWSWRPQGLVKGELLFDLAVTGAANGRLLLVAGRAGLRLELKQGEVPLDALQALLPKIKVIKGGNGHAGNP